MTEVAGIGNFFSVSFRGADKLERVAADTYIAERLGDFRHVAGDTLTAGAVRLVVGVLFQAQGVRAARRLGAVAVEAEQLRGLAQARIVRRAVGVVAGEAGDSVNIHLAVHEIVALHAVLVGGAIGEVREAGLAEFVFFEFPVVAQFLRHLKTYGPVVVLSLEGIL